MTYSLDIIDEAFDTFDGDASDIRDLIQTTPLTFDDGGLPFGYDAEQLFGLESAALTARDI